MFTGIIQQVGEVRELTKSHMVIRAPQITKDLKKGSSIAVDGACLTVTDVSDDIFRVEFMPETYKKTIIPGLNPGSKVNLELALAANGRFEGHIVQGHVEAVGEIQNIESDGNSHLITVQLPDDLENYAIPKGSITINGVSLTIISVKENNVTVGIIPHTWNATNLGQLSVGDMVNVETDLLAKYIEKLSVK